jgi:hypothetical protein
MRKRVLIIPFLHVFFLLASTVALAQTAIIDGSVMLKAEDGTLRPVGGALVDIYRLDVKGHWNVRTDSTGHFVRLGMPQSGTYLLVTSGPGIKPTWVNNVRLTRSSTVDMITTSGDSSQMSLEQVLAAIAQGSSPSGQPSISQTDRDRLEAAKREYEMKLKEGRELQPSFDTARTHYNLGIELTKSSPPNHSDAITEFEQATKIDPLKHAALLELYYKANANLAESHYQIGVELFNKQNKNEARLHFDAAVDSINKAINAASSISDLDVRNDLLIYYSILAKNAKILIEHYGRTDLLESTLNALDKAEALDLSKEKWETHKAELTRLVTPSAASTTSVTVPSLKNEPGKEVHVRQYTRKDGTVVKEHTRSAPRRKP